MSDTDTGAMPEEPDNHGHYHPHRHEEVFAADLESALTKLHQAASDGFELTLTARETQAIADGMREQTIMFAQATSLLLQLRSSLPRDDQPADPKSFFGGPILGGN